MKLPKCPHCEKLLLGSIGEGVVVGSGMPRLESHATYLCPETLKEQKPEWVEVLEV